MNDQEYYRRRGIEDQKHKRAINKAQNRADIATEWFKTHTLMKETVPEFKALMKKADRDFENQTKEA